MFCYNLLDFFLWKECKYLNVFLCIVIAGIKPKLVKFVYRSLIGIQPNVTAFRLPNLHISLFRVTISITFTNIITVCFNLAVATSGVILLPVPSL